MEEKGFAVTSGPTNKDTMQARALAFPNKDHLNNLVTSDKGCPLLIVQDTTPVAAVSNEETVQRLEDPEERKQGERKGGPVNEGFVLVGEDTEKAPCNGNTGSEIAFWAGEGVSGGSGFKEEQSKEYQDLSKYTGVVSVSVHTEGLEGSEDNEIGGPSVVEREGKVNPEFIVYVLADMALLDGVIDVRDSRADEQGKDKGDDIVLAAPNIDVDGVKND